MARNDEYYRYQKPEKCRVTLLGESAVYTRDAELCHTAQLAAQGFINGGPEGFVRLVYCLGYSENGLLDKRIPKQRDAPVLEDLPQLSQPDQVEQGFCSGARV
jgi:hypothetical protein